MSISCSSVNMTGLFLFFLVAPDVLGCVVSSSPSSGGGDSGGVGDLAASSYSRLFLAASSSPESCAGADCFWLLFLLFLGGMMSVI